MNGKRLHIVFAGGGTLGHLFPGLAVAAELKRLAPSAQICFAGSGKAVDQRHVLLAGYDYLTLACHPRPKSMFDSLRFVADNARGWQQAARYLRTHRPDAVVGLGGYASYPMARAAHSLGVSLILLEQNALPGRATRRLAPRAKLICLAFEEARLHLRAAGPIRVTGNPVRQIGQFASKETSTGMRRLLVLGGSQGSESLNTAVPRALSRLLPEMAGWSILHQAGEAGVAAATRLYAELGLAAHVRPFVENLPQVMAHCHLAISRAGGTTLAELAAAGLPAMLVPYPAASDDHQRCNAAVYAAQGGCRIVDGRHGPRSVEGQLVSELPELLTADELRQSMSTAMRKLARPAAAWHVAQMILDHVACAQRRAA